MANAGRGIVNRLPRPVARPLEVILETEAASAVLLLAMAVAALGWASSPWKAAYHDLWAHTVGAEPFGLHLSLPLEAWINDGLMTAFFFVVALEIKRELVRGELRDRRTAALPVLAAVGGMVVPALVYAAVNAGHAGSKGWGIPMATDIAFAVGVLALLGRRVPPATKLFLLALAIVDDLGAISVIAVFYTAELSGEALAAAAGVVGLAVALRVVKVQSIWPYLLLAPVGWVAVHQSGVHATLAGVAFAFLVPAGDGRGESGMERLEARLVPVVGWVIVPLFALTNAGVDVGGDVLRQAVGERVALGVAAGLVAGKTAGILAAAWIAVRVGVARRPGGLTWRHLAGVAALGGIGFTVALFIANLSFADPAATDHARVGILGGSLLAGLLGYGILRSGPAHDS